MAMTYFQAYYSYLESIEPLNDEERGRLFTALLVFASTGEVIPMTGNERFIFPTMKAQIVRDLEAYESKCKKLKSNAENRYQKTKLVQLDANGCNCLQMDAIASKEKEKKKEKEKEKEKEIILFNNNILNQTFLDFEKMRKSIKKPLTERARKTVVKKLEELSAPYQDKDRYMIECLERSILNNWLTVYDLPYFEDKKDFSEDDKVFEAYLAYQREDPERSFSETLTLSEFAERWRGENAASS